MRRCCVPTGANRAQLPPTDARVLAPLAAELEPGTSAIGGRLCTEISIGSNASDYDLMALNALPGPGFPICVVVDVDAGVTLNSTNPSTPAFNTGVLDIQSHVGIRNSGNIIGRGGDGGVGGGFSSIPPGDPGKAGLGNERTPAANQQEPPCQLFSTTNVLFENDGL